MSKTSTVRTIQLLAVLVAGGFIAAVAFAQTTETTTTVASSDIPEDLIQVAQELGCNTKAACESAFGANLTKGIEIAERYKVYDKNPEVKKLASTFKQEVLTKLASATEGNFEEIIIRIAKDLVNKKPTLAKQLSVTKQEVNAADTIVQEIKKEGVDLTICRQSAELLTREQLVACLNATKRLADKKEIVKPYIHEQRIDVADEINSTLKLDEAITRGEYNQLGAKNAEELGVICLRPDSPVACDEIASRFFGQEGAKMLAQARQQVTSAGNKYRSVSDSFTLVAPDGRTITGKTAIKSECERAFNARNVELARACGQFAVKNGVATEEEMEEGLEFIQSVQGNVDLNTCRTNPGACEEFIPQEKRGEFVAFQRVEEIMKAEVGFDPRQCEQGGFNPEIGQRCFEGSKRALPRLEELARSNPAVQRIVEDIRSHIIEAQNFEEKRNDIQMAFQSQQGGPGGCRSADECFKYCSDVSHGPECIAFGAQQGVFSGNEAVSRFEQYNDRLDKPAFYTPFVGPQSYGSPGQPQPGQQGQQYPAPYPGQPSQYSGQQGGPAPQNYPYSPGGPNSYGGGGAYPAPGQFGGPYGGGQFGGGSIGPSPECFTAIQSGDFVKAKTLCAPPTNAYQAQPYPGQTQTAQQGQYQPQPYQGTAVNPFPIQGVCPALPTVTDCPSNSRKVATFSSPECGTYYACEQGPTQPPQQGCPQGQYWDGSRCVGNTQQGCPQGQYWDGSRCTGSTQPSDGGTGGTTSCPSGQWWDGATNRCTSSSSCGYGQYWDPATQSCRTSSGTSGSGGTGGGYTSCSASLVNLLGTGCHSMYTDSSGRQVFCDGPMTKSAKEGDTAVAQGCSSSGTWTGSGSGSGYPGDANSCPGFSYSRWDGSGRRYCQLNNERKCDYNYPSYLTNGANYKTENCPASDSSTGTGTGSGGGSYGNCDWTTQYWKGSTNSCAPKSNCTDTSNPDYNSSECYGVRSSSGTSGSTVSGQRTMTWNSFGLSSQIRNDADNARVEQLKQSCANVRSGANIWMPNAGTFSSPDFGMPDPNKCQQAASCSSTQYFDGTACTGGSATTGGGTSCGAYTTQTGCVGATSVRCDWRTSGSSGWCQASSGTATCGNYICESGEVTSCSADCQSSTSGSCPSGQWWNGTNCVSSSSVSGCTSAERSALGDGCHYMSAGIAFNGAMTAYYQGGSIVQCSTSPISECSGSGTTSTSCPSGQYWNGSSCVTSGSGSTTSCPSGQYWNGTACASSTSGGTVDCSTYGSGWHTMDSSGNCFDSAMQNYKTSNGTLYSCASTPASGCPSSSSQGCPSGQYWNGSSCATSGGSTSCTSGQYWNGTSCVSSTTTTCPSGQYWNGSSCVSSGSTTCPSGQYWNGSSCVTSSSGNYSSDPATACSQAGGTWQASTNYCQMPGSTSCPSGQYWNGTSCVATSSTDCPSGQYWNGSSCVTSSSGGTTDPATACAQSGGSWNGSTCQMPTSGGTSGGGTTDPSAACSQAGGTWDGSTCQMPGSGGGASLPIKSLLSSMLAVLEEMLKWLTGR